MFVVLIVAVNLCVVVQFIMPRDKTYICPLSNDPRGHYGRVHVVCTRTALRRHVLLVHGQIIDFDHVHKVDILRQPSPEELARRRQTYRRGQQHKGRQNDGRGSDNSSDAGVVVQHADAGTASHSVNRIAVVDTPLQSQVDYGDVQFPDLSDISFENPDCMEDWDYDADRLNAPWFDIQPEDLLGLGREESSSSSTSAESVPSVETMDRSGDSRNDPDVPRQDPAYEAWCQERINLLTGGPSVQGRQRPPTLTTLPAMCQTDPEPEHLCRKQWSFNVRAASDAIGTVLLADPSITPMTAAHRVAFQIGLPRDDETGWRDLLQLTDTYVRMEQRIVNNLYQIGRMGMATDATGMSAFIALLTSISLRMARPLREAEATPSRTEDVDADESVSTQGPVDLDDVD